MPSCPFQDVRYLSHSKLAQVGEKYESWRMIAPIRVCARPRIKPAAWARVEPASGCCRKKPAAGGRKSPANTRIKSASEACVKPAA